MLEPSFQMPAENQIIMASQLDVSSLQAELFAEKSKREKLEQDLEKITSLVYDLLKSVNKLTYLKKSWIPKKVPRGEVRSFIGLSCNDWKWSKM